MKKAIKIIQKDIIQIFRSGVKNKPLNLCCKDSCSEASRLVAIWIKRKFKRASVFILKGEHKPKKYHDILITQLGNEFYLIDPTVWQFFKNKRSILIGKFNSINELLLRAKELYGGKWGNIEKFTNFKEEKRLIKIIKSNL
jgi:hypothetical protein